MSQLMMLIMMASNSMLFMTMKHPMTMGASLLIQTMIVCLMMATSSKTTWFSYILFIVFMGGLMVIFIYMTSMASNEKFKTGKINKMFLMMMPTILIVMDPLLLNNSTTESESNTSMSLKMINSSMFNYPYNSITIATMMYLFLTLIVVVYMTKQQEGPMRSKN